MKTDARDFSSPLATAPAFLLLICWCVSLVLTESLHFHPALATSISLLAAGGWGLAGTIEPNRSSLPVLFLLLFFATAGSLYLATTVARKEKLPVFVEGTGVVTSIREWGVQNVMLIDFRRARFLVKTKEAREFFTPGDVVHFSGHAEPLERTSRRGTFDAFLYWRGKGVLCEIKAPYIEKTVPPRRSRGPSSWRFALGKKLREALPRRTAGYLLASWTGEKDPELVSLHRAAGTSHLLAVSGFHVGIVFSIAFFLLRGVPFRLYFLSVLLWTYILLAGSAPSAVRAGALLQSAILGRLIGRPHHSFNAISSVGAAMLLFNPWIFWDVGWRMSMLAALSITSVGASDIQRNWKIVASGVLVWLATAISATRTFGYVPVVGLIVNFVAIPFFGVLLPLASLLSLPPLLGVPGGKIPVLFAEFAFTRWEQFSGNMLQIFPWDISFGLPLLLVSVIPMVYFFAIASGFRKRRASVMALFTTLFTLLFLFGVGKI